MRGGGQKCLPLRYVSSPYSDGVLIHSTLVRRNAEAMTKLKFTSVRLTAFTFTALFTVLVQVPANGQPAERFEISALKAVRPTLTRFVAACDKGEISAAKTAYEDFETGWKGIQVYVIMRDRNVFQSEGNLQVKIVTALKASQPNMAALAVDAKALASQYDTFIAAAAKLPPLNPLFDDVARLRIARAQMRAVDIAIRANDFSRARTELAIFSGKIGGIKPILVQRSPETWDAFTKEFPPLQMEIASANPNVSKCLAHIRAIMSKYTRALTVLTRDAAQPV
jgi:hypothetical protein